MYAIISSYLAHARTAVDPNPGLRERERERDFSDKTLNRRYPILTLHGLIPIHLRKKSSKPYLTLSEKTTYPRASDLLLSIYASRVYIANK